MGEATYGEIRAEFDRRREAGDFRSVQGEKYSSGRSFTTPETIAAERANVRHVLEGRNAVEPIMSAEQAREQANTRDLSQRLPAQGYRGSSKLLRPYPRPARTRRNRKDNDP